MAATMATASTAATTRALRGVEAIATQHGTARRGLEWHFGVTPTLRAGRRVHLLLGAAIAPAAATAARAARMPTSTAGLALLATTLATRGLVGQPALAVERLLSSGEQELLAAIHAGDAFVLRRARHGVGGPPGTDRNAALRLRGRPKHERPSRHTCRGDSSCETHERRQYGEQAHGFCERSLESPLCGRPTGDGLRAKYPARLVAESTTESDRHAFDPRFTGSAPRAVTSGCPEAVRTAPGAVGEALSKLPRVSQHGTPDYSVRSPRIGLHRACSTSAMVVTSSRLWWNTGTSRHGSPLRT